MRLISFSLTTRQFLDGSKTVTRRLGWRSLRRGDRLVAVERSRGLHRGQHPVRLGEIEVVSARREPLARIDEADCAREGFRDLSPAEFVGMFCAQMRCTPATEVTRIEFKRSRK